uniref:Uncharacterized protein n=1 Tax=Arundo donax TaxID=35708 RepID=A0A0A9F2U8_ARUDO
MEYIFPLVICEIHVPLETIELSKSLNQMHQKKKNYMRGRYAPPWPFLRISGPAFSGTLSKTLLHMSRTSPNPVATAASA